MANTNTPFGLALSRSQDGENSGVVKNCYIPSTNANKLYVGDAVVGEHVNVGAGTITANYDSRTKKKSKTIIENNVSIGSNAVIVAPVTLGAKSMIGAGSVITKDVENNSLALTRSPQKEIKNYIK